LQSVFDLTWLEIASHGPADVEDGSTIQSEAGRFRWTAGGVGGTEVQASRSRLIDAARRRETGN
ncbi:MAG: hypothetical protein WBF24_21675, partial [Xanthobacteraceae bacterium]